MRQWIMAFVLLVSVAPAARACGIHARIEGPASDGITYTARTQSWEPGTKLEPWALAEGLVDGKFQSVLIRLKPTSEPGVYQFTRTWTKEGRWMIRYLLGHPPTPVTVATLGGDGMVQSNKYYFNSDGSQECRRELKPLKPGEEEEGC